MASAGNVSDDQQISLRLLCGPVQQLRDVTTVDDHLSIGSNVLLKCGDFAGCYSHHRVPPLGVDPGSSWAEELDSARDVDERKLRVDGRGHLGGTCQGVPVMRR